MASSGLSKADCDKASSGGKPDLYIADGRQPHLYLRVLKSDTKTWVVRKVVDGKLVVKKLGRLDDLDPKQARLKAGSSVAALQPGRAGPQRRTVREASSLWYETKRVGRYRRPEQVRQYLDRDLAPLANRQLARITTSDLEDILLTKRATAPIAANKLRVILSHFFAYAALHDWIEKNPMLKLTFDEVGTPTFERERVLSDDEIRKAWNIEPPHGSLYQFLLASGQRLSEVLALAADPSCVRDGVWHIEETKSGRPHRVPMTPLMRNILAGGIKEKKRAAAHTLWRSRIAGDATQHDIRRTVATRMRDLGVGSEAIEALLNHQRSRLLRTYQRPDMLPAMRAALALWQAELLRLVAV